MCQSYYHPPRGKEVLSKTRWLAATVHCEHEPFLLSALASGNCLSWRLLALHWLQDRPTSRLTDMTATAYFRWVQITPVPKQKLKEDFQTCTMLMSVQELYKYCIVGMWKGNTRTSLPEGVIFLIYCKGKGPKPLTCQNKINNKMHCICTWHRQLGRMYTVSGKKRSP